MKLISISFMNLLILSGLSLSSSVLAQGNSNDELPDSLNSYTEVSIQLLNHVRTGKPTLELQKLLAEVSKEDLNADLDTEEEKKAFWLNVYNAYVQILLLDNPDLFDDRASWFGYNFFSSPQVTIAGHELSFDDIEHGIIRHSKIKLSMGYLDKWFPDEFEKTFRWKEVDPRIHFALNCGAKSCPYIAIYEADRVEEQLDITSKQYLERTTDFLEEENKVFVNRLMSWFKADFGGKKGSIQMLKKYGIIPESANPKISYIKYDWTLELDNYKDI